MRSCQGKSSSIILLARKIIFYENKSAKSNCVLCQDYLAIKTSTRNTTLRLDENVIFLKGSVVPRGLN